MEAYIIWMSLGIVLILLEFFVPGGIVVFLGVAATLVGAGIYLNIIETLSDALITWFISSLILMLFLRSLFMKFFEGDSSIVDVDEDHELMGSVVVIVETIHPYKEGRVKFRDTTWKARSDEQLEIGASAIISGRDGNTLVIKSI
ncbi:MAG: NfeD family protein [Bdellovibrionales bacterium]|nr:NfeD family protein [Bdellovibrionales bacterium]